MFVRVCFCLQYRCWPSWRVLVHGVMYLNIYDVLRGYSLALCHGAGFGFPWVTFNIFKKTYIYIIHWYLMSMLPIYLIILLFSCHYLAGLGFPRFFSRGCISNIDGKWPFAGPRLNWWRLLSINLQTIFIWYIGIL